MAYRSALIPKREVGADAFTKANPSWDGRGVLIAVFDTGVDPGALGLALTATGQRKIVDIVDGTGSGDADSSTRRKPDASGKLLGLSGRWLTLPQGVVNPSGEFRLGLKPAAELFYGEVQKRLDDRRAAARDAALAAWEAGGAGVDPGALFDCVLWRDGNHWRVVIDTDEDGDLRNARVLRPFGVVAD